MRVLIPLAAIPRSPWEAAGNVLYYKSSREAILHRTKIDTPVTRPAPIIDASDEPIGREREPGKRAVQERGRQAAPSRVRGRRSRLTAHARALEHSADYAAALGGGHPGRRRRTTAHLRLPPPATRVRIIPRYVWVPAQAPVFGGWGVFSARPSRGELRRGLPSAYGSRPGCRSPWCRGRCGRGWPG